ncbi:hypothetical protein BJY00DRAFT_316354 [Aspergillus carlsbadensis]|nr:hypothetical protein BJY00DRAFT_316354 [Aspergillus carlsbadensis]
MRFATLLFTLLTSSLLALAAPAETIQALTTRSEDLQPDIPNVRIESEFQPDSSDDGIDVDGSSTEKTNNARPQCPANSTCGLQD